MKTDEANEATSESILEAKVGYCRPPRHSRFRAGVSGNPAGRVKGSKNLKTLFRTILNEQVSLREGPAVRRDQGRGHSARSRCCAMKGDIKCSAAVLRLAEQAGEFEERSSITRIERVIVQWKDNSQEQGSSG